MLFMKSRTTEAQCAEGGGGGCKFNSVFFGVNFSHDILTPQVKVNMWETAMLETAMLKK